MHSLCLETKYFVRCCARTCISGLLDLTFSRISSLFEILSPLTNFRVREVFSASINGPDQTRGLHCLEQVGYGARSTPESRSSSQKRSLLGLKATDQLNVSTYSIAIFVQVQQSGHFGHQVSCFSSCGEDSQEVFYHWLPRFQCMNRSRFGSFSFSSLEIFPESQVSCWSTTNKSGRYFHISILEKSTNANLRKIPLGLSCS